MILCFLLSYGLLFTVLFSVSLLGTCINIFQLSFLYSSDQPFDEENIETYFNDARLNTLTVLLVEKLNLSEQEFKEKLIENIIRDSPDKFKEKIIEKANEYYGFE